MNTLLQFIKRHWLSVLVYGFYLFIASQEVTMNLRFVAAKGKISSGERLSWGEGIIYGLFFFYIISAILALVTFWFLLSRKETRRYYSLLMLLLVVTVGVVWWSAGF